ncbi:MAG TPA: hypothetical protein DCM68_03625 [Verrucomicrobia bacterium]|nr:hypothetical protein [Verrucomicrobiota bacterium]
MPDPNPLLGSLLALLGALGLLAGVVLLRFPAALHRALAAFPRSKWPGWILTAICVSWVAWVISHAALGRFEGVKPLIPVLAILGFAAIVCFLDELLAPRALGGLLLLVANPMLHGVRWADSPWRFVVVLIAYAWVIAGCALMLHPWLFRRMAGKFLSKAGWVQAAGWGKLLAGAVLLAAGLWHLR